tara:strand:+ start:1074 stop:1265 length:192 start_codon:yes stop_codon:yes gene_type:complete
MSSATFIPYYKKEIERFNGLAEFAEKNGQEDKQAFFSEQAKMYSSRMMDIKTQEFKELSNGAG